MKIQYTENGKTKEINLKEGSKWSDIKTNNKTLNSLFGKIDNGNGEIDEVEVDALLRQMNVNNTDGNVKHLSKSEQKKINSLNWTKIRNKVQVAENIYDDVNAKTAIGTPTTGKNIRKHVYAVTVDNATTVCKTFSEKTNGKETIIGAILTEYGLSFAEREEYIRHIVKTLAKDLKQQGKNVDDIADKIYNELNVQKKKVGPASSSTINKLFKQMLNAKKGRSAQSVSSKPTHSQPTTTTEATTDTQDYYTPVKGLNGKIDRDFQQSSTVGDCWLLASIKALALTPKGKQILDDSVTIQKDGNVRVTLKGVNATYVYTPKQIKARTNFSSGDLDVRALEMAVDDYLKEHPMNGKNGIDNGNTEWAAYEVLVGKTPSFWNGRNLARWIGTDDQITNGLLQDIDDRIDNFNKPNHVACVAANGKGEVTFKRKNGNNVTLHRHHAYTVKGSDKNYVYLINPWDTSKTITITREEFKSFFDRSIECDL